MDQEYKKLENNFNLVNKNFEYYLKTIQINNVDVNLIKNFYAEIINENGKKQKILIINNAIVSVKNNKTLLVQPNDKNNINVFYKSLSSLNANVVKTGDFIEIVFPPTTTEEKKRILKLVAESLNQYKIQVKNIRQDFLKQYKSVSKEELSKIEKKVQELIDKCNKHLDLMFKNKELEFLK